MITTRLPLQLNQSAFKGGCHSQVGSTRDAEGHVQGVRQGPLVNPQTIIVTTDSNVGEGDEISMVSRSKFSPSIATSPGSRAPLGALTHPRSSRHLLLAPTSGLGIRHPQQLAPCGDHTHPCARSMPACRSLLKVSAALNRSPGMT